MIEHTGIIGDAWREVEMLLDNDDRDLLGQLNEPLGVPTILIATTPAAQSAVGS